MNTILLILFISAIILALIYVLMRFAFRNPQYAHRSTPDSFHIPFTEIHFPTKNSRTLYGWWIPFESQKNEKIPTYILVHGWGRNVERMLDFIRHLHPLPCHILTFDARSHGSSDKDSYATMLKFAEDISAAVDFVSQKPEVNSEQIGVIGHSIGGAASIYAAAHDSRIKKVAALGAFSNPQDIMRMTFKEFHIPYFPIVWVIFKYVEFKIGKTLEEIAPVNNISNSDAKFLLVHGTKDRIVPFFHAEINMKAARDGQCKLLALEETGHSNFVDNEVFWPGMEKFLCQ